MYMLPSLNFVMNFRPHVSEADVSCNNGERMHCSLQRCHFQAFTMMAMSRSHGPIKHPRRAHQSLKNKAKDVTRNINPLSKRYRQCILRMCHETLLDLLYDLIKHYSCRTPFENARQYLNQLQLETLLPPFCTIFHPANLGLKLSQPEIQYDTELLPVKL